VHAQLAGGLLLKEVKGVELLFNLSNCLNIGEERAYYRLWEALELVPEPSTTNTKKE